MDLTNFGDGAAGGLDGAEDGAHLGVGDGGFASEEEGAVHAGLMDAITPQIPVKDRACGGETTAALQCVEIPRLAGFFEL